jgi:hypothetical protein
VGGGGAVRCGVVKFQQKTQKTVCAQIKKISVFMDVT